MNWLAQVSPSSAASVGVFPSNKTLEAGLLQMEVASRFSVTLEQRPTTDDPLAASTPRVEKLKLDGMTGEKSEIKIIAMSIMGFQYYRLWLSYIDFSELTIS